MFSIRCSIWLLFVLFDFAHDVKDRVAHRTLERCLLISVRKEER